MQMPAFHHELLKFSLKVMFRDLIAPDGPKHHTVVDDGGVSFICFDNPGKPTLGNARLRNLR